MTKLIETKYLILFLLFSNLIGQDKGQKLFEQEKYDEARKYYESILERREDDKTALFGIGSSAYYQNDIEGALNSFGSILGTKDDQLNSKSYYNLARIFQDKNELEKSLALYRKSLELNPSDIDAKVNYELLKRQISQNQNQKDDNQKDDNDKKDEESQSNKDESSENNKNENQTNEQNSDVNKNENSKKEDKKNELAEENRKEQEESNGDKKDENSQSNSDNVSEHKSDELMQAEAILNALKDQEKINQKQKILKTKSLKFDKDW